MRKTLLESLIAPSADRARRPRPTTARCAELARERRTRGARGGSAAVLSIRQVDAGSCNGCELEIHALNNAFYDLERFGLRFVASPRHADVLLVTGPVTKNMREALERTYAATPDPKWVVAVGDCAATAACSRAAMPSSAASRDGGAGRPAHPRLPADPDRAARRPAGAGHDCGEAGSIAPPLKAGRRTSGGVTRSTGQARPEPSAECDDDRRGNEVPQQDHRGGIDVVHERESLEVMAATASGASSVAATGRSGAA